MPKRRDSSEIESEESENSSSGSDVEPAPKAKKSKNDKTEKSGKKEEKKEKSNKPFRGELGKMKFVTISTFKGNKYVDIREWYTDKNTDEDKPGKKGIALDLAAWEKFKALVSEVDDAIAAAK